VTERPEHDPRRALAFGAAAATYAAARPSYPREAVRWLLPGGAKRVLDLGAGTGKLTEVLLGLGLEVVAVEPDEAMRAHIDARATVLAGTAEQLPDVGIVDAVVVGQAWHWFSAREALASIRRVLPPGGTLGLLWNLLDDRAGWWRRLPELVHFEDVVSNLDPTATRPYEEPVGDGFGPWERLQVSHEEPADKQRVIANLGSRSVVLVMGDEQRAELFTAVDALVPDDVDHTPYVCDAWRAVRSSTAPEGPRP
jgi:SAM-dependent methyltransferase